MARKRTPRSDHKILCILCGFKFQNAERYTYHLCAVHTGLPDAESPDDGGGYFVCRNFVRKNRLHKDVIGKATVGQGDHVEGVRIPEEEEVIPAEEEVLSEEEEVIPEEDGEWRVPNFLRGGWQGRVQEQVPNVRNAVTIHVVEPSYHPMRVMNTRNIDCFRVSARVKATGAVVFAEVPCSAGSPAAIFRDCPELEPYFPEPVTTLTWVNTPRYVSSATILVTTLSRCTQAEQERLGLTYNNDV